MVMKGLLKEDGKMVEELNSFFVLIFTVENVGHTHAGASVLERLSEELCQIEVTRASNLALFGKLRVIMFVCVDDIYPRVL